MGLVWKYGWKNTEDGLKELKMEFVKRSEELKGEIEAPLPSEVFEEVKTEEAPVNVIITQLKDSEKINQPIEEKKKVINKSKMKQRDAEKRKREENEAKGIFVNDLLTEENLRKWHEEGYSNAYISRELVGCREEEIGRAMRGLRNE